MAMPPKAPPRFVPTLTEVVQMPGVPQGPSPAVPMAHATVVPLPHAAPAGVRQTGGAPPPTVPWSANASATAAAPETARPLPEGMEEYMVHRVMQRVDVVLDQRLREAIAIVVQEQTRSVLPRLREEIESVVRHAVYEAVAEELASGTPTVDKG